jgi:GntR family histidine utilization transcriptional repressor
MKPSDFPVFAESVDSASEPAGEAPFARIKRHLKDGLATGTWPPGSRLPSEAELVGRFGVSRMTAGRALRELHADGLISRVQGVGSFAAPLHRVSSTLTIRDLHEEITARGHRHRAVIDVCRAERASAGLAAQLGLRPGERVFHTRIVHLENDSPLQCEDRFVNPVCAPDYLRADFSRMTPTHYLFRHTSLWRAQYSIESALPTRGEARLLGIKASDPCLIVVRRTFSRDSVITLARLVHPGNRYQLSGEFSL